MSLDLKHLEKVRGLSHEDIVKRLSGLDFDIMYGGARGPNQSDHFFRHSDINVAKHEEFEAYTRLGGPDRSHSGRDFYYAEYETLPGFSLREIPGKVKITINDGRLVERTTVYCRGGDEGRKL
jgi:hypothetical protein